MKKIDQIVTFLESSGSPEAVAGMAKYGITGNKIFGVSIPKLRLMGRELGHDHELSLNLWAYPSRETRILAALTGIPDHMTGELMEEWVLEFDSWEVCDQVIMNLFEKTRFAYLKAASWSSREEEFVKRAGFVLMARLAVSDKKATDEKFKDFFPYILKGAVDNRVYVRKGVNWAVRQIGKRNLELNKYSVKQAEKILEIDSPAARWIASDALRELRSESVLTRLEGRAKT
ncbi:DNA alkylation repair protein [Acidobacteriota bacterium]